MQSKFRAFSLFAAAVLLLPSTAGAQQIEPAESNCFFLDRECIGKERIKQRRENAQAAENARREKYLSDKAERDAAHAEEVRFRTEQAYQARKESEAQQRLKDDAEREQREQKYQQYLADRERQKAAMAKEREDDERAERIAKKRRDIETADLKARCGNDYKTPSIGMRIERVQECIAPTKLVSQLNRADGVVSTYRSGEFTFHVMSGRVMAWDRY